MFLVLVVGVVLLKLGLPLRLDIEEVLSGVVQGDVHVFVADVLSLLILLIVVFWIGCLVVWVCRAGSGMLILSITLHVRLTV